MFWISLKCLDLKSDQEPGVSFRQDASNDRLPQGIHVMLSKKLLWSKLWLILYSPVHDYCQLFFMVWLSLKYLDLKSDQEPRVSYRQDAPNDLLPQGIHVMLSENFKDSCKKWQCIKCPNVAKYNFTVNWFPISINILLVWYMYVIIFVGDNVEKFKVKPNLSLY